MVHSFLRSMMSVIITQCDDERGQPLLSTWHAAGGTVDVTTASYYPLAMFLGCPEHSLTKHSQ